MTYAATIAPPELDELSVNTLHFLAIDIGTEGQVRAPRSADGFGGHGYALGSPALKSNPHDPLWPTGMASSWAGHGCALLYALLMSRASIATGGTSAVPPMGKSYAGACRIRQDSRGGATAGTLGQGLAMQSGWPSPK